MTKYRPSATSSWICCGVPPVPNEIGRMVAPVAPPVVEPLASVA
jgi:hypothetical protein